MKKVQTAYLILVVILEIFFSVDKLSVDTNDKIKLYTVFYFIFYLGHKKFIFIA